jgi:outer membrane protein assembly factor BamE (lipoprotein component of BamABCDE complex)
MNNLLKIVCAGVITTGLSGCIIVGDHHDDRHTGWKAQQEKNRQLISDLEINTSRQAVVSLLGAPEFSEAYTQGTQEYRVLYYRTHHVESDGDTTKDETTPLVFKNNQLIGWGHNTLAKIK